MKRLISLALAVIFMLVMVVGCSSSSSDEDTEDTTTTEDEETEDEESEEESEEEEETTSDLSGSVATNGSTSMESVIGYLSEQFMEDNPGVTITYDATGSGTGIESTANGTCDIGLASRNLKDEELEQGLVETTLALDAIAVIVNEDCAVDDLSVDDLYAIFTGEVTDWSEYGGEGTIACIGREAGSGTRDGFESATGTTDLCVLAQELTSTGSVIEAVANNSSAIGYASLASVEGQDGIKVLTIDGVEPSEETTLDGTYAIQRPFVLVTLEDTELSEAAQAFYDYMLSEDAYDLIREAGAVPMG